MLASDNIHKNFTYEYEYYLLVLKHDVLLEVALLYFLLQETWQCPEEDLIPKYQIESKSTFGKILC